MRWPNLWLIPAFTDETREILLAISIYRGQAAPLTNVDPYIGSFWNWLIAAGFSLFGLSPWLPRLLVFVAGVATVGASWWLGRELGGRLAGAITAVFMAASSTHILVNSHVAWSHAITPLFTTLGLACLARVLTKGGGRWLVAAAALLGLGVQTHATAALLLPGAALAVLLRRPALLRTRWALLAAGAFLLANANLVVYNVQTGGRSLTGGLEHVAGYTGEDTGYDPRDYVGSLGRLTLAGSWILSGAIEKRRFAGETLVSPPLLLYLGLALGGVLWAARRGLERARPPLRGPAPLLPLLVIAPYVLMLPLLNPKYEPLLNGRYLVPLLPLVYAGLGLAFADAWTRGKSRLATLLVAALLAAYPLLPLARYETTTERTNEAVIDAYRTLAAHRQPGETVLLDYGLDGVFYMAAGSAFKSMELLLSANDVPYVVIDARASSVNDALAQGSPRLALLHSDKVTPLGRAVALTPLGGSGRGPGFGVYRVAPRR